MMSLGVLQLCISGKFEFHRPTTDLFGTGRLFCSVISFPFHDSKLSGIRTTATGFEMSLSQQEMIILRIRHAIKKAESH